VDLESLHCVLIVGSDKHSNRHVRVAHLFDYFKSAFSRHLDIKEKNVDAFLLNRGNDFSPIPAFSGDFNVCIARQKKAKPFAGQRFVISDECL
jgi:hypothetical protein